MPKLTTQMAQAVASSFSEVLAELAVADFSSGTLGERKDRIDAFATRLLDVYPGMAMAMQLPQDLNELTSEAYVFLTAELGQNVFPQLEIVEGNETAQKIYENLLMIAENASIPDANKLQTFTSRLADAVALANENVDMSVETEKLPKVDVTTVPPADDNTMSSEERAQYKKTLLAKVESASRIVNKYLDDNNFQQALEQKPSSSAIAPLSDRAAGTSKTPTSARDFVNNIKLNLSALESSLQTKGDTIPNDVQENLTSLRSNIDGLKKHYGRTGNIIQRFADNVRKAVGLKPSKRLQAVEAAEKAEKELPTPRPGAGSR